MGRFKLSAGYTMIPEGTHVFKITAANYDEDFGKMVITMVTKNGASHNETFTLLNADGSIKDTAMRAFGYLAQNALNDFSAREIDEQELVGCYLKAEVVHRTGDQLNTNGEPKKYVNLARKYPASGFEDEAPAAQPAAQPAAKGPEQVNSVADMMSKWGL